MKRQELGLLHPEEERTSAFGRVLERLALAFAIAMAALVLVQNICFQLEEHGWLRIALLLAAMVAAAAMLWGFGKLPWSSRTLLAAVLGVCLLLRLAYLLAVRTPVQSDFYNLYSAALQLLEGDTSWTAQGYFYWWGYQIPFVAFQALVLKIIPSVWALKALNLAFMVGVAYLLYRIARLFLSERAALAVTLLYAIYPEAIHLVSVLTNQHIAAFFLLLGVWLLLSRRSWPWMLLAGGCMGLGNLMRPEGAVFLATLVCCAVCLFLRCPKARTAGRLALGVGLVLITFWGTQKAVGAALQASGIAPLGIENRVPEWKFVLGLDASNPNGGYSEKHIDILDIQDDGVRKEETKRVIVDSFRASDDIPGFFLGKTKAMWAWEEPFYWSTGHLDTGAELAPGVRVGTCLSLMSLLEKTVYLLVWAAVPAAAVLLWRHPERRRNGAAFFSLVAVCAFFCIYLLIEVQPRYRYIVMPLLFLSAGLPLERLYTLKVRPGALTGTEVQ